MDQEIHKIVHDLADELGFEVVDIDFIGKVKGRRGLLRVFIDKEGGVTIGDCEVFSRRLEALMDVEDLIKTSYLLEVSSPGLDRPIKKMSDFKRHIGKLVRIVTKEKIDNQTFFIGRVVDVSDEWIRILLEDRKPHKHLYVPFKIISRAQLEIEMKKEI